MTSSIQTSISVEPAILDAITNYLPNRDQQDSKPNAALVLQTIENVSHALPSGDQSLVQRFSPSNQSFWRKMVLRYFDFTVDPTTTFNVEDLMGDWERNEDDELRNATFAEWERKSGEGAVPGYMLVEDLCFWKQLNVYFRPSQYQFLTDIQQRKRPIESWSAAEGAFALFKDLAILVDKFTCFGEYDLRTYSDGDQFVYPCLLSRLDSAGSGRGYAMLQHCGVVPHYWVYPENPVSKRWPGLGEVEGIEDADDEAEDVDDEAEDMNDDEENEDMEDDEEDEFDDTADDQIFPLIDGDKPHLLEVIKSVVLKHMSGWRNVTAHYSEECSPTFYIGKSKYSGRWYGFAGQRDY